MLQQYRILQIFLFCIPNIAFAGLYIPIKGGWSYYDTPVINQSVRKGDTKENCYQDYIPQDDYLQLPQPFLKSLLQAKGASVGIGFHFSDDLSIEGNYLGYRKKASYFKSGTLSQAAAILPGTPEEAAPISQNSPQHTSDYLWTDPWAEKPHTTIRVSTPTSGTDLKKMWDSQEEEITNRLSNIEPTIDKKVTHHGLTYTHGASASLKLTILNLNRSFNIYGIGSLSYLNRVIHITSQELKSTAQAESSDMSSNFISCHVGIGIRYKIFSYYTLDAAWISTVKRYALLKTYHSIVADSDDKLNASHIHLIKIGININF